jgi:glycerol-3-phosphate dehydrogenase
MHKARVDIAIFGGGIAGLWTLARLRQAGFSAVLFESQALGGVQSIASQGIIHGGAKYALTGNLTESARAIGTMPGVWRACLEGAGELDLRRVRVLSEHQYLWSTTGLVSRMAGFFAGKAMRSRMIQVETGDRPGPFRNPSFKGTLYRLEEQVLDMASLFAVLSEQLGEHCYRLEDGTYQLERMASGAHLIRIPGQELEIEAGRMILAAGKGNAGLLQKLGRDRPAMQLRPLHMVIAKGDLPAIHAHCLGSGTTPRITVTSYPTADGRTAWYLGGQVAESGVDRSPDQQMLAAKRELAEVLPWIDITDAEWSSLRIDRTEHKTPGGLRPESYFLDATDGVLTVWPTKLAFAPRLAQEILEWLEKDGVVPHQGDVQDLSKLARPDLALPPWEVAR